MVDIYRNTSNKVPKSDPQIVRVSMEEDEISGRKDRLPSGEKPESMSIKHVPNSK